MIQEQAQNTTNQTQQGLWQFMESCKLIIIPYKSSGDCVVPDFKKGRFTLVEISKNKWCFYGQDANNQRIEGLVNSIPSLHKLNEKLISKQELDQNKLLETILLSLGYAQLSLPKIPQGKRIIPNDLIRSSLFTVVNHKIARGNYKEKEIFAFGNTLINYTGEELRQDDEDVLLQLIQFYSKCSEDSITFLPYTMLRELGWPARTQYRDKLKCSLNRMSATNITIINKVLKEGLSLSLVRKFRWRDDNGSMLKHWAVWLEPEIVKLFSNMSYSKILWDQRKKLKPLGKWLHSYYTSHAEPYPIKVSTIHKASGSRTKAIKHFKPILRDALVELKMINFLEEFWIDALNRVHVVRLKQKNYCHGNY